MPLAWRVAMIRDPQALAKHREWDGSGQQCRRCISSSRNHKWIGDQVSSIKLRFDGVGEG
jgi:hypothetical protein